MPNKIKDKFYKYFNKDVQYFVYNSKYKVSYQIIGFLTSFLISWLFANFTSIEFYGTFLYIQTVINFFSFLSFSGILSSIIQSVAKGYDYFYISGMKKILKYSSIGTLVIIGFSLFYFFFVDYNLIIMFSLIILGFNFPFLASLSAFHYFLDGKGQFKKDFFYKLLMLIIQNAFLIILVIIWHNLILYYLIANVVLLIIQFFISKRCINSIENKNRNEEIEKESINYGLFLTKYGILSIIANNINGILIGILFSNSMLAFYTVGIGLPSKLIYLIQPSFSVLLTKYSKKGSKISKSLVGFIVLGSIISFLGVIFFLPIFLNMLFPAYIDSLNYGIFYSIIILIQPITNVFGYYYRGKADKKVLRNIILITNLGKLVSLIPLILIFSIYGIIFAEILKWLLAIFFYLLYFRKTISLESKEL